MSDTDPANPRFPLFDSLRAIAALCVVGVHLPFAYRLPVDNPYKPYLLQLNAGVALFFLISGFLLYRPFARARFAGESRPAATAFATRRALRITPAYWLALPAVVLLIGPSGEAVTAAPVFSPRGAIAYFGFLQTYDSSTLLGGISAAWTLGVEVAFYALLPFWAMLMRRVPHRSSRSFLRSELLGLAALFAIGVAWTGVAAVGNQPTNAVFVDVTLIKPWLYVLPSFLDHFALGMGLAVVSVVVTERRLDVAVLRLIDRAPWISWVAAAIAYFALAHVATWFTGSYGAIFLATHELQAIFALALLLPAAFGDPKRGLVRKVLGNRVLLWVGLVSYGLYLWHAALISKGTSLGLSDELGPVGFTLAAVAASLLVAAASFYLVERPALRLGRRLSHRKISQDADMRVRDLGDHEQARVERL